MLLTEVLRKKRGGGVGVNGMEDSATEQLTPIPRSQHHTRQDGSHHHASSKELRADGQERRAGANKERSEGVRMRGAETKTHAPISLACKPSSMAVLEKGCPTCTITMFGLPAGPEILASSTQTSASCFRMAA